MSYLQVTASRPSLHTPDRYNTLHGLAIQRIASLNIFNFHNSLKPTVGLSKKCTELMTRHMVQRIGASRYQQCTPVCLFGGKPFGGKGSSRSDDEDSPWKSIEKAMGGLKKEQSLEDVLRQQMDKKDYYDDDGNGEDPPIGGGGDGGGRGGFRGTGDGGFAGMWDDIQQVTFAILALVVAYVYIIMGDRIRIFIAEGFEFLAGKRGPRLRTIMLEFAQFYTMFRGKKVLYDPYWLEKAIITTPTYWDSPAKYQRMLRPQLRKLTSSSRSSDSDNDDYENDSDNRNTYGKDSDDDNRYRKKAYSDDDNDNDAYSEDDEY
ncbi:hypothetical protein OSB04_008034 [Centaurea solstitialis]|uniref:Uncharacterized protein n=1 Tax=Centaurea solstitialis TaxID=347529 RepID=A0AA38TL01_9ASTR|nr:hypothetical protein OSB04_008034 [Centaurea solstitialis]